MTVSLKEERSQNVLKTLSIVPLLTTNQLARLMFPDAGSPTKRASEFLCQLEEEKILESQRIGDMRKVWRLSKRGRIEAESNSRPIPFTTAKLQHWLTIGDVYLKLRESGGKLYFETELRLPYKSGIKEYVFAPDVFFIFKGKAYLMEVQLKRLSKKEWSLKWQRWNDYFNGGYYKQASWQRFKKDGGLIPYIIVESRQSEDIVREGFAVRGREIILIPSAEKLSLSIV